jgi:hypothetical protein
MPAATECSTRTASQVEGQFDLTVVVALMPKHVLEKEDRVVVMKVRVPARLHPALYRIPHHLGALVQHLRDAARVMLDLPLLLGQLPGELRNILQDKHESNIVDVCVNNWATDGLR